MKIKLPRIIARGRRIKLPRLRQIAVVPPEGEEEVMKDHRIYTRTYRFWHVITNADILLCSFYLTEYLTEVLGVTELYPFQKSLERTLPRAFFDYGCYTCADELSNLPIYFRGRFWRPRGSSRRNSLRGSTWSRLSHGSGRSLCNIREHFSSF